MTTPDDRVFLDAKTTAHRYGITTKTLQRWVHNPDTDFPQPRTIGNRWYFRIVALEEWEQKDEGLAAS